jgi:preprotein translocase subunit YajC
MNMEILTHIVVATQYAQEAEQGGSPFMQMIIFMIFIFLLYWLIYARPVAEDQKKHQKLIGGLIKGDKIVSIGGIVGEIVEVQEHVLLLDVGKGSLCTLRKTAIKAKLGDNDA